MIDNLMSWIKIIPDELAVVILSTLPITELRASIPFAIFTLHLNPIFASILAIIGNLIPGILILLFFPLFLRFAEKHIPLLHHVISHHLQKMESKYHNSYHKCGFIFLLLFVAIPFPGSGVWTGSALAVLFGMKQWYSFSALVLGCIAAALIVLMISLGIDYANFY